MQHVCKSKSIILFVIVSITFSLITNNVFSDGWDKSHGRGYVIFESNQTDMDDLNSSIRRNGYSQLSNSILSFGLGGHDIRKNRIVLGGYASFFFPRENSSTVDGIEYTTSMSGGLGTYSLGYLIYSRGGTDIFPLLGFGFGGFKVHISEKESRSFEEVLESPQESTIKASMYGVFNIALGIDRLFILKETDTAHRGLGFGFRLGYRVALIKADWLNVVDGPDFYFTGPYFNMTFGGGYNKKD